MGHEDVTGSWKNFFVIVEGTTNGAHRDFVVKLKSTGQSEMYGPEWSDYLLVFCPVVSRVGTDINEALRNIRDDKPIILVVMHHTFDPDYAVAESRRQVNNPNVHLTVDCLFYEDRLLRCQQNETAWFDVQRFIGVSASQASTLQSIRDNLCRFCNDWKLVVGLVVGVVGLLVVIVTLAVVFQKELKLQAALSGPSHTTQLGEPATAFPATLRIPAIAASWPDPSQANRYSTAARLLRVEATRVSLP